MTTPNRAVKRILIDREIVSANPLRGLCQAPGQFVLESKMTRLWGDERRNFYAAAYPMRCIVVVIDAPAYGLNDTPNAIWECQLGWDRGESPEWRRAGNEDKSHSKITFRKVLAPGTPHDMTLSEFLSRVPVDDDAPPTDTFERSKIGISIIEGMAEYGSVDGLNDVTRTALSSLCDFANGRLVASDATQDRINHMAAMDIFSERLRDLLAYCQVKLHREKHEIMGIAEAARHLTGKRYPDIADLNMVSRRFKTFTDTKIANPQRRTYVIRSEVLAAKSKKEN
jgi:hypothetical protein